MPEYQPFDWDAYSDALKCQRRGWRPQNYALHVPRPWPEDGYSLSGADRVSNGESDSKVYNIEALIDIQGISNLPGIYQKVFHGTYRLAENVKSLVERVDKQMPGHWAIPASLLVEWSLRIIKTEEIRFMMFLHSQRASIYSRLDEVLLQICVRQWEHPSSSTTWDRAIKPLQEALSCEQTTIDQWLELHRQHIPGPQTAEQYLLGCVKSRKFLQQSARIHEIWRTMKLWGHGKLPAELAAPIVEYVLALEDLPNGDDLAKMYMNKWNGRQGETKSSEQPG